MFIHRYAQYLNICAYIGIYRGNIMSTKACEWRGIQRLDDPRRKGVDQWEDHRTYREWLFGLLQYMEKKGSRPCRVCGETCRVSNLIITENGGLWIKWRCVAGHLFEQVKGREWLKKTYKSNIKKRVIVK
jgi:hypothetical protein